MERLSQGKHAPPDGNPCSFTRCWICGHESNDICEFRMWQECDEQDKPEGSFIIACRSKACNRFIDKHPRLYVGVMWAGNTPGRLMLVCSDCEKRQGFECTDPRARTNGGDGLSCRVTHPLTGIVCTEHSCYPFPPVVHECEGYKKKDTP